MVLEGEFGKWRQRYPLPMMPTHFLDRDPHDQKFAKVRDENWCVQKES